MKNFHKGAVYMVLLLVMTSVFIMLATAMMGLAFANLKLARHNESMVSSLSIAEAGVNYYLWHLSHASTDYCDGHTPCTGSNPHGPYEHPFKGPDGTELGTFWLTIKPPSLGNTVTEVTSKGQAKTGGTSRTVIANIGLPSFAGYALIARSPFWITSDTTTNGPVHSNIGIRFDGTAEGPVTSSSLTYTPTRWFQGGINCDPTCDSENGVWAPPDYPVGGSTTTSFWQYNPPTPNVDFGKIGYDLTKIRDAAQSNGGLYLSNDSKTLGYYLNLKGDVIDIYKVTNETGTGLTTLLDRSDVPGPTNGVLYVDDYLWVSGTWNGRITIASSIPYGRNQKPFNPIYFGNFHPAITITNNLTYVAPRNDGNKKIGLVADGNIAIASYVSATDDLEIDAAIASAHGSVWYQRGMLSGIKEGTLTIYGSIAAYYAWRWYWDNNVGSPFICGFLHVSQTYDQSLTIDPPPMFPTTGDYQVLTWREE